MLHERAPLILDDLSDAASAILAPVSGVAGDVVSLVLDDELARDVVAQHEDAVAQRDRQVWHWVRANVRVLVIVRVWQSV